MPNVDSVERNQLSAQAANVWNNVLYVASHKKDISYNPFNVRVNPADICLMLTIETLEQGVKYVQS